MKKAVKIAIVVILMILVLMALAKTLSHEDDWICDKDGEWVKHGFPSAEKPHESCKEDFRELHYKFLGY